MLLFFLSFVNDPLFTDLIPVNSRNVYASQQWEVELNIQALFAETWDLNLPDLNVGVIQGSTNVKDQMVSFKGKVNGEVLTDILITHKEGASSGIIFLSNETYVLETTPEGTFLNLVDPSSFPLCAGGIDAPESEPIAQPESRSMRDSGDIIDVLVLYTPQARDAAGGTSGIETLIQNAIDITNTAYANSQINPRLNLVHTALANYSDSGNMSSDLSWVRNNAEVAQLRNDVAADLVALIVNGGGACGIGYVQRNPGPSFESNAFQVTARSCAVGNLSFAHEFGHNQGCEHNPENSSAWPSNGSFPWSYGHYTSGSYRTVMSYSSPCSPCGRQPYISNSNVSFNGTFTGVLDERENYRTINETAQYVANFRQGCPVQGLSDWPVQNVTTFVDAINRSCLNP